MRIFLLILLISIFYSCEKKQTELPKKEEDNNNFTNDYLIIGDSTIVQSYFPPFKLINNNNITKDSIITDTLYIDIDENGKNEFTFIYVGEFVDFFAHGTLEKPTVETIYATIGEDLMRLEGGYDYGSEVSLPIAALNDTLSWNGNWIWSFDHTLYKRIKNQKIGTTNELKNYIAFKQPAINGWGWISFQLIFDDYYFDELIIEEYGYKQKLE